MAALTTLTAPPTLPASATYLIKTFADGINQIRFLLDDIYVKRCSKWIPACFFNHLLDAYNNNHEKKLVVKLSDEFFQHNNILKHTLFDDWLRVSLETMEASARSETL